MAALPQPNNNENSENDEPLYKDKKEAIEAFKELLKDRVRQYCTNYKFY